MQNSVAAIRAARVHARFVLPPAQQRVRQLGLRRLAVAPLRAAGSPRTDGRGSLRAALMLRGGVVPAPVRRISTSPLRSAVRLSWSSGLSGTSRRPAIRRATPWHG